MSPTVAALFHYPIKGCAGLSLTTAELGIAGVPHDRSYVVVRAEDGKFMSQRTHPPLATIRPALVPDGDKLTVTAPGIEELVFEANDDGAREAVTVHSWQGEGTDQGDEAAQWFSDVLGEPARLLGLPPDHQRAAPGGDPGTVGFADAYPLLVTSSSSLDELNARILERGGEPVPMDRFRPNIVVNGWPTPHTEDTEGRLAIGGALIEFAKLCKRCTVPLVDQETGRRAGPEPIRTLADYRRHDGGVVFGSNYRVLNPGKIAVGDEVHAR